MPRQAGNVPMLIFLKILPRGFNSELLLCTSITSKLIQETVIMRRRMRRQRRVQICLCQMQNMHRVMLLLLHCGWKFLWRYRK
jgi:hypothetical protein